MSTDVIISVFICFLIIGFISFKLFNPFNEDITDKANITFNTGDLEIVGKGIIDIYVYEKSFVYDGTAKGFASDEYLVVHAPNGVEFVMHNIRITATNVSKLDADTINSQIYDFLDFSIYENGVLQESGAYAVRIVNFSNNKNYNVLTITKREITIQTASAKKPYDGEALPIPASTFLSVNWVKDTAFLFLL